MATKDSKISPALILAVITLVASPQVVHAAKPADMVGTIPMHAEELRISLSHQLLAHPDWVYMMSWNSTAATVDYLGPAKSNPHLVRGVSMAPIGTLDKVISTNSDTSNSGSTSEWKEVANFTNQKITSTSSDLFQILDALSSNRAHWFQIGVVYDNANLLSSTPSWRVAYNSFNTSACTTYGEWFVASQPQNMNPGDSIQSYIYADTAQAGHYILGEKDYTTNTGTLYGFGVSGDTGHVINLGEIDTNACHYTAGPEQEEQSNGSIVPTSFTNERYSMGYYDTPTSQVTKSIFGWNAPWGTGCVTLDPIPPPTNPASVTFHYGC